MITITEAIYFLMTAAREEIHDDVLNIDSVRWTRDGNVVGYGRFSTNEAGVSLTIDSRTKVFPGSHAVRLRVLGVEVGHSSGKLYPQAMDFFIPEEREEQEYEIPEE